MAGPGRKRRFLLFGAVNVLITNLALQGLLLVASTGFATFLSQLLNVSIGFVLYGKGVFRVDRLQRRSAFAYGLLALLLWWVNWAGISVLVGLGCARHLAALLLVPALAVLSYAAQKLVVFRSNP
jgi:hypothetical protein